MFPDFFFSQRDTLILFILKSAVQVVLLFDVKKLIDLFIVKGLFNVCVT